MEQVGQRERKVRGVEDVAESSIVRKQYYDCKEKIARFQGSKDKKESNRI
jgi:hypothetical protein